jgi:RHS repeat-associated protein
MIDYYIADVISAQDYYPFGMIMPGRTIVNGSVYRYGFNGKENDNEVKETGNQQDYGMRIYDPRIGKFLSFDPLAKSYPMLTPFQFASNSPIMAIDLDGLEAYAVYNKATSQLALIPDVSKVNPKLTYKFVSAIEYSELTVADKVKANYGILVKNVFTGGHSDGSRIIQGDPKRPKEKPISTGTYSILENKGNENPDHASFFVLDPQDDNPYDKVDDRPGEINSDGEKRSGYNLHPGRISWGCVTICKDDPIMTPEQKAEEWKIINGVINSTKSEKVPDKRGNQKYVPFTSQTKFGTLIVIDKEPASTTPSKTGN